MVDLTLRFAPERGAQRIRMPLGTRDLGEALKLRDEKEKTMNALSGVAEGETAILQTAVTEYIADIKKGRSKKTYQAYEVALRYLVEAIGNKPLGKITCHDLMDCRNTPRRNQKSTNGKTWTSCLPPARMRNACAMNFS
jgi:hypothetical protein